MKVYFIKPSELSGRSEILQGVTIVENKNSLTGKTYYHLSFSADWEKYITAKRETIHLRENNIVVEVGEYENLPTNHDFGGRYLTPPLSIGQRGMKIFEMPRAIALWAFKIKCTVCNRNVCVCD